MKTLLALLVSVAAAAQPTITPTLPISVQPGNTVMLTISMSGSAGLNVAAVQWSTALPAGFTIGAPAGGTALPAGDAAYCGPIICLVAGTVTAIGDGTLATVPLIVSATAPIGTVSIPLTGLVAASTTAASLPGVTAGPAATIKVLSPCDVNGDGSINVQDVLIVIDAVIGTGSCPISVTNGGCTLPAVMELIIAANGGACKIP